MTLQDLKDNRTEIIDYLVETIGNENVKEGMQIIAKMIGFRGYEGFDVMQFVKAAIKDNGIADRIIMTNGYKAQARLEEINIESSKNLMKSI